MGAEKADLLVGGRAMLARVVDAVAAVVDEVVVVGRPGQALTLPRPRRVGVAVRRTDDAERDVGPLAGLAAGFAALDADVAFVASCDVPLLTPAVVAGVLDALRDADAAVPEVEGTPHPLVAAWRRGPALAAVRACLATGRRRVQDALAVLAVVRVPEAALRAFDPTLDALRNVNTPEDLERARAVASGRG